MATLALGAVGATAGSALLPAGLSVLGTTLTGAAVGSQVGALAGRYVDAALFGTSGSRRIVDGPRLNDLRILASTEGAPIPRLYGRACLGGQVIWACNLTETVVPQSSATGGLGKGGRQKSSAGVDYTYTADFAVALCEGPISGIGKVWADGSEIDISQLTCRVYTGTQTQAPDPYIAAKQSATQTPAYLGVAYVVFEQMPLAGYGNRIPQLAFEVFRPLDALAEQIRGVALIPGSGEFVYEPAEVTLQLDRITAVAENIDTQQSQSDWAGALDQLQTSLPNAKSVSLVVSWFGTSLDASQCQLLPKVDTATKVTLPYSWSVSGVTRSTAQLVSQYDGTAAFGGTPSDQSVIDAIRDLRSRGLSPVLSPFILMDVPHANTLSDPYAPGQPQPAYPWRGRITVAPAAGVSGTADKTAAAATALANFVGTAQPQHFSLVGTTVVYSGPNEYSFRRMILHNAMLAVAAGGVDAFVLCSELRGLTTVRSDGNAYPFVAALVQLAADVRSILGSATKIVYAADWSEYFGHQPADGSGDVHFHLDPLWSSPNIDAIGIDCYWPLADWRDGASHLDLVAGAPSIYDQTYLKSNIAGGEGYAWYYASAADRVAQNRTPISDGHGKPWVYRYKDLVNWWSNRHFDRPGGVEAPTPTSWVPQSKPVWFMELGCPAVDKGANEPNVFIDPKSSESNYPYFSGQTRDDAMQRAYLQAFHDAFDPASSGYVPNLNPTSSLYNAPMLDLARLHVYCWDARPYPAFPNQVGTWGDCANWTLGHWITGRIASVTLAALLDQILADYDFPAGITTGLSGVLPGYVIDTIMSARGAIQPLELSFFFDSIESDGGIVFRPRANSANGLTFTPDTVVETRPNAGLSTVTRDQETDLPVSAKIAYTSTADQYPAAIAEGRRIAGRSQRVSQASLPLVLDPDAATQIADTWLFETWAAREKATFTVPPSQLALEPADTVTLVSGTRSYTVRITDIGDHGARDIEAQSIDLDVYNPVPASARPIASPAPVPSGPPLAALLDLPLQSDSDSDWAGYIAANKSPWPGTVAAWRTPDIAGYTLNTLVPTPATTGLTVNALPPGPTWRPDVANTLTVQLDSGSLTSVTRLQLFGGANTCAVERAPNVWEVIQFQNATLVAPNRYALTVLLRGQSGTDPVPLPTVPAGARFVLLDGSVLPVAMSSGDVNTPFNWKIGPASRDIGDPSYLTLSHTFSGAGLIPYRPVQIAGSRDASGDLTVTWLRRTRRDGDSWDPVDVPLAEDSESYEIDILSGTTTAASYTVGAPSFTYTAAQQTADLGSAQAQITMSISQLSRAIGKGTPTVVTL